MFDLASDGPVARLCLNRPVARNAIPMAEWPRLAECGQQAVDRGARVLILSGTGAAFCAGADISEFEEFAGNPNMRAEFRTAMRVGLDAIAGLPIPTIAVIEGDCYGAGVALAMACDIRISGGKARFAITPAKLGISYPQEDVRRLIDLVGQGHASRLLLAAAPIDGLEALRIGLVEEHHEDGTSHAAERLAKAIAANDPDSLRALKSAIACDARSEPAQDRQFDDLLGAPAMRERLANHRGRKG